MNNIKCGDCKHFDPIKSGKSRRVVHGWCAVRSVYPHREGIGQVFPPGVKRAETPQTPAKPEIVEAAGTVKNCIYSSSK